MKKNVHYRDILRCHANGMSQAQIAKACGCSRSAVQDAIKLACEKGVTWNDVAALSEKEAYERIRGKPRKPPFVCAPIDFAKISKEMAKDRTMTLSLLWDARLRVLFCGCAQTRWRLALGYAFRK